MFTPLIALSLGCIRPPLDQESAERSAQALSYVLHDAMDAAMEAQQAAGEADGIGEQAFDLRMDGGEGWSGVAAIDAEGTLDTFDDSYSEGAGALRAEVTLSEVFWDYWEVSLEGTIAIEIDTWFDDIGGGNSADGSASGAITLTGPAWEEVSVDLEGRWHGGGRSVWTRAYSYDSAELGDFDVAGIYDDGSGVTSPAICDGDSAMEECGG